MTPSRFVAVSAAGVLAWITRAQRSRERDLVEHLFARDADQAIDVQVMARHLEMSVAELGRILFALNRSKGIRVSVAPPQSVGRCRGPANLQRLTRRGRMHPRCVQLCFLRVKQ
jgi:hypothetical protein